MNYLIMDVVVMIAFGVIGYILRKFGYEGAPMVLAHILGPMFESALLQSLAISDGSFLIFVTRPYLNLKLD